MKVNIASATVALLATVAIGCGGNSSADSRSDGAAAGDVTVAVERTAGSVSADRAKGWPAAWCAIAPGDAREQVRAAMGEPTESYDDQDQWDGFGWHLTAFYDTDFNARQLDVSSGEVPCAESRRP